MSIIRRKSETMIILKSEPRCLLLSEKKIGSRKIVRYVDVRIWED